MTVLLVVALAVVSFRTDGRREDTAILAGRIARARADPGRKPTCLTLLRAAR
jgi:hypothetical protein